MDATRSGVISDDVGNRLLEEVDLKLDRVHSGETTVSEHEEGYEEFWRIRADEFGIEAADLDGDEDEE